MRVLGFFLLFLLLLGSFLLKGNSSIPVQSAAILAYLRTIGFLPPEQPSEQRPDFKGSEFSKFQTNGKQTTFRNTEKPALNSGEEVRILKTGILGSTGALSVAI